MLRAGETAVVAAQGTVGWTASVASGYHLLKASQALTILGLVIISAVVLMQTLRAAESYDCAIASRWAAFLAAISK